MTNIVQPYLMNQDPIQLTNPWFHSSAQGSHLYNEGYARNAKVTK